MGRVSGASKNILVFFSIHFFQPMIDLTYLVHVHLQWCVTITNFVNMVIAEMACSQKTLIT